MRLLECGHAAVTGPSRVCEHLLVEEPPDFYRVLTGSGMRYDLACVDCVERAVDGENLGWRGTPGIRHEDRFVAGTVRSEPCDVQPLNDRCLALVAGWR